jgi:DNA-binding SARP family transcriptional activator/predicted ATPase
MSPLRIYLFGAPRFERDDTPIHIPRRKAVALLAYLATTSQPHSRDALATMFWPEHDQTKARANLRRELSRTKSALGEEPFKIQGEQLSLNSALGWWLDVADFQTKLNTAQGGLLEGSGASGGGEISRHMVAIQEAVSLYTNEFMAGFSLPDSPQFDEWQFFQRESLNRSLGDALQKMVYWHTAQGDYEAAIEYARRWLALDNLFEQAHRQLMQLYAWSGQQGAAIRQYEQCQRLLLKEIGVEPEEETFELYEAIKTRQLAPPDLDAMHKEAPWIAGGGMPSESTIPQELDLEPPSHIIDLAVQSTPFIGRQREQDQLTRLLTEDPHSRLVSVVGPGGVGKTRLALETASAVQEAFLDGVFTIPLTSLASADQILPAIAEQLNLRFQAAIGRKQQLFDYLHKKQVLLLMDNFEHVLSGAPLVAELLQTAPGVKVLVTSRQRLNLADEVVISLRGMDFPLWEAEAHPNQDFSAYEAVQLLVQSARRVQPEFELQPQDYESVARLCSLVEGMPLAIILAASWLEMLSPGEIVDEILRSLDFLESQAQDIPERQRSLRAVFDASWSSLEADEQAALERLTIFQGSFTRQAALAVTGATLTTLLALIQKAWLQRNQDGRFQIHELQRQYAFDKLRDNPQAWEQARHEHSAYYAQRLETLDEDMRGTGQDDAYHEVGIEFVNLQIAWNWLVERDEYKALIYQMLPPLYRYCEARQKSVELLQLVQVALESLEGKPDELKYRNVLLTVQASFYSKGDSVRLDRYDLIIRPANEDNISRVGAQVKADEDLQKMGIWGVLFVYLYGRFFDGQGGQDYLRQLVGNYRQIDQPWELALALQMLGGLNLVLSLHTAQKEPVLEEAGQCLNEALAIFERLGDRREYSYSLLLLGGYHANQRDWEEAISIWKQAQAQFDELGETISSIHWLLGELLFKTGDYQAAFQYYREIREAYLQRGQKRIAAYALSFESLQALRYSTIEHARQTREQSLRLSQEVGDPFGEAWSIWEMGEIQRVAGDYEAARLKFERANQMFAEVEDSNGEIFYYRGLGDIALAEGDEDRAYSLFEQSFTQANEANFIWGAAYAQAGMARAAAALKNFAAARKHLSQGLKSVSTIEDTGLALIPLAACAQLYAARGEVEQAIELCSLVVGHFAAWKETKDRATKLLNDLKDLSPGELPAAQEPGRIEEVWDMANRLLETDFKPD